MNKQQLLFFDHLRSKYKIRFDQEHRVHHLDNNSCLESLSLFPPFLSAKKNVYLDLYEAGYDAHNDLLMIANKGATLLTVSPFSKSLASVYHIGACLISPTQGIETVNIGFYGDFSKHNNLILRPESACSPSFIFGSQRCNCNDQWLVSREVAALLNPLAIPSNLNAKELEEYIKSRFIKKPFKFPLNNKDGLPFLLVHFDSQNGMGSGSNKDKYSYELTSTAFMRHRGEYSAEQIYNTSVAGGFRAIDAPSDDPRTLNNSLSYRLITTILNFYEINHHIYALTNNENKIYPLKEFGFTVSRVPLLGRSDTLCELETRDRKYEYHHLIDIEYVSQEEEIKRLLDLFS